MALYKCSLSILTQFKRCFCILHHPSTIHEALTSDPEYDDLRRNLIIDDRTAHSVFVCQPFIQFPVGLCMPKSTPELQLKESISLIHSIPKWKVSDAKLFPVHDFQQPKFFSEKTINEIGNIINGRNTTGLFISADRLLGKQQHALEKALSIPVFDRYSIILEIFKNYAITAEAQIQLGLAEINYLKSRIQQYTPDNHKSMYSMGGSSKGSGMTALQRYQKLLNNRAKLLNKAYDKIESHKQRTISRRKDMHLPSVSVIGYTNSGKTSLIKALSQNGKLFPEDRLFATLEVTSHKVRLPRLHKTLFLDSVGFISNIPKDLIDCFKITFKEVASSDLLLHVYDISHPDLANQKATVFETIKLLNFPQKLVSTMVNVANKIDLLEKDYPELNVNISESDICVSVTEGHNMDILIDKIDIELSKLIGQKTFTVKVPNGGDELSWLHRESIIQSIDPDADAKFLVVKTTMNEIQLKRFVSYFRKQK